MHLGLCFVRAEGKKGGWVGGTGVTDGCEVPVGAENCPGSLAEHPALKLLSHLSSPASSFLLFQVFSSQALCMQLFKVLVELGSYLSLVNKHVCAFVF